MYEVLVNRLGSLSLPRKSVVRLTDRPDMTLDVYRGRKTTMQQQQCKNKKNHWFNLLTTPEKQLDSTILFVECLFVNRKREKIHRNISIDLDTVHVVQRFHHGLISRQRL